MLAAEHARAGAAAWSICIRIISAHGFLREIAWDCGRLWEIVGDSVNLCLDGWICIKIGEVEGHWEITDILWIFTGDRVRSREIVGDFGRFSELMFIWLYMYRNREGWKTLRNILWIFTRDCGRPREIVGDLVNSCLDGWIYKGGWKTLRYILWIFTGDCGRLREIAGDCGRVRRESVDTYI